MRNRLQNAVHGRARRQMSMSTKGQMRVVGEVVGTGRLSVAFYERMTLACARTHRPLPETANP